MLELLMIQVNANTLMSFVVEKKIKLFYFTKKIITIILQSIIFRLCCKDWKRHKTLNMTWRYFF